MDKILRNIIAINTASVVYLFVLVAARLDAQTQNLFVALAYVFIILLAFHTIRSVSAAQRGAAGRHLEMIGAIKAAVGFMLLYVLARIGLSLAAPVAGTDYAFALIRGLQTGLLISFFYALSTAAAAVEKNPSLPVIKTHPGRALLRKMATEMAVFATLAFGSVYVFSIYLPQTDFTRIGFIASVAIAILVVSFLARKETDKSRPFLDEKEVKLLDKIYLSTNILTAFLIGSALQEVFFVRASLNQQFAILFGGALVATLVLTFFTFYYMMKHFAYSAYEYSVEKGKVRQKPI